MFYLTVHNNKVKPNLRYTTTYDILQRCYLYKLSENAEAACGK